MAGRPTVVLALLSLILSGILEGQDRSALQRARQAYEALNYEEAVTSALEALQGRLSHGDAVAAYELLGYSYAVLDSTQPAVVAFRDLIFLDPDREPDPIEVSPRITALYALALSQVLVVRRVETDSVSFLAGEGAVPIRFAVSRPGEVSLRVVGRGLDVQLDSQIVAAGGAAWWSATTTEGIPVPPGRYQLIIEARDGTTSFEASRVVEVRHAPVDTLEHLTVLAGFSEVPEMERPPRNLLPLSASLVYVGLAAGGTLALESFGLGPHRDVGIAIGASVLLGVVMSIRKPDPQPVEANIRYNRLLRQQLAQRNADIARQNAELRRRTLITIVPQGGNNR